MGNKTGKILFVLSIVALVAVIVWKCEQKTEFDREVDRIKSEVIRKQAFLDSLEARHDAFRDSVTIDKAKTDSVSKAFKMRISRLEKNLRVISLRNATKERLDSVRLVLAPETSDTLYCMPITASRVILEDAAKKRLQDTILVENAAQITGLQETNAGLHRKFERNDELWQQRYDTLQSVSDSKDLIIQTYERKERKSGFARFAEKAAAVLVGVGIGALIGR